MSHFLKFILLFFLLGSCAISQEEVYSLRKNRIVGEWEVSVEVIEYKADTIYQTYNYSTKYLFDEDGTGSYPSTISIGETKVFDWFYQFEPEMVLLNEILSDNKDSFKNFSIIENSSESMEWEYSEYDSHGVFDVRVHKWNLSK